jgi:hypothetical protein
MAYIPENAKWYLADVIIEIRIEAEPRSLVHINTVLVRADSPEEAHNKSLELGQQQAHCYENTDGKLVTGVFRGLGEVTVIHDDLEHGAELIFKERVGLSEEQILALVRPKDQLGVFAPREPSVGPNYMPRAVMDALKQEGYDESDVQDRGA